MKGLLPGAVKLYLNPGEMVLAEAPAIVTTVLGSCVSVTLFYPPRALGSICHAVLPGGREHDPGKYADQAVRTMIEFFADLKVHPQELTAKIFGGADMFPPYKGCGRSSSIGAQNVQAALAALSSLGIEPKVSEVGGHLGRKLVFVTHTGEVFIRRISKEQLSAVELKSDLAGKNRRQP